ncbi:hypothetical protein NM688_g2360 [Phlebia brevispora]|uniref:Uncharacterized protein n=1 Tax=Phlebia brevispora TaxID=194682 RepID=A0ACC1T8T1_9APHY|nr:hypothetical protein NM688_g2360 [Phlebia brevispora]
MYALTLNDNVFVLTEDGAAPGRNDLLQQQVPEGHIPTPLVGPGAPPHFRWTYLTLSPPGALEELIQQLRARWVPVRQSRAGSMQRSHASGQQIFIEGVVFSIGTDFIVRVGNVVLAGGAVKGMLLEAEYLPLPTMQQTHADGTMELLSDLLVSVLPPIPDAETAAVTMSDSVWAEVMWDREEEEEQMQTEAQSVPEKDEDIYVVGDEDIPAFRKNDWIGVDRDRRSAFLILGALRQEGLVHTIPSSAHFYDNRQLELYAAKETRRLTLRQLVYFGRSMNEDRIIKSANYVRTELPVRIAHRLREMQTLPYVVVTQEGLAKVYELYWSAFEKFRRYPQINTLAENQAFCTFLRGLLHEHATVIPNLSLGLSLSSPYLAPDRLDSFMRRMLVSRISRRVLAEHHIALSRDLQAKRDGNKSPSHNVGIIDTALNVKDSIDLCTTHLRRRPFDVDNDRGANATADWPEVIVDGHVDIKFPYIKEHLEYIIFELVKNSLRATRIHHPAARMLPPIRATVVSGENLVSIRISDQGGGLLNPQIKSPSDLFSFSHIRNAARLEDSRLGALRTVSSREQGLEATVHEQLATCNQIAKDSEESDAPDRSAPHSRIGIGLPMSNIFATYLGGSLELVSMDGYGTDMYPRLPRLGTNLEGIEV